MIKKVEKAVSWTFVINDLQGEEIVRTFYEKELQKTNQKKSLELKKNKKSNKLYVKWKG